MLKDLSFVWVLCLCWHLQTEKASLTVSERCSASGDWSGRSQTQVGHFGWCDVNVMSFKVILHLHFHLFSFSFWVCTYIILFIGFTTHCLAVTLRMLSVRWADTQRLVLCGQKTFCDNFNLYKQTLNRCSPSSGSSPVFARCLHRDVWQVILAASSSAPGVISSSREALCLQPAGATNKQP